MKRFLQAVFLSLAFVVSANAQDWSMTLSSVDGLPGVAVGEVSYEGFYEFSSVLIEPGASTDKVRITVIETINNEAPSGNNVIFSLSELKIYDRDGIAVPYNATSNADHNSLAYISDGGGLPALSDDDYKSYFHSMWSGNNPVADYHYVELALEKSVDAFRIEWTTRFGQPKNSPTKVAVTLGTDYVPKTTGSEFALGDAVATEQELSAGKQLFVLRGNAVKSFTASNGTTYSGSGPIYMQFAEEGDITPSAANSMQLIPAGHGRYLVYWPVAERFLANSSSLFNGLNGWQYSTNSLSNAAYVKFTAISGGYFEMQYDGENANGPVTLYVGAELRDGVDSKMKTFDLVHKDALEMGDYTQGFSMPVAFNWSIYKAELDAATVDEMMITVPQLARTHLSAIINKANSNLTLYGNHGGYCTAGEDETLRSAIASVQDNIPSMGTVADITAAESTIFQALSRYMSAGLSKYEAQANSLLASSTFSQPPYVAGTYPESSRAILTGILSTIAGAKEKAGIYTAEQYVTIYSQIEREIAQFQDTYVEEGGTSGGDGEDKEEEFPEEPADDDLIYVYLSNGDVDAFAKSSLEGGHYIEDGTLYFPLQGGDTQSYAREEYDSCTTVRPVLPEMTSFKFNNKYNPTLNVDVVCDAVTNEINLDVNAIGKWLTASFQLSDDRAVAYVDTVLQVSKESCHSFAGEVSYTVTYPGYNIVKFIKVQDELWTTPQANGDTIEVALAADMLSTNKPSQNASESLANLLDDNSSTIFHSTWGSANNATLNVNTYIEIDLPEPLENFLLYYKCRPQRNYNPLVLKIYASNDGSDWTLVRTLDYINDNMPTGGYGQEYTSPVIALNGSYSKLKIEQTSGEYSKNHFVLSELRIYNVLEGTTEEPVKIQDAIYENRRIPFGNVYNVKVNWIADNIARVPRIDIDIDNGLFVTSKEYYLKGKFSITGYGVYDDFEDSVQIKGRGNSSWGYSKKPYRLKFADKVKPFGLTKGKSWVLLANAQEGSLMANAIAMKIGQMAGAKYTNHIIPVELYMNGQYMGSYMFTEKVGMANNSVDIDEALGYLVELDTYSSSDEPIYTRGVYGLPVKISEPDLDEIAELYPDSAVARRAKILNDAQDMQNAVSNGSGLEDVMDVDATARFFLVNDLVLNQEINHPKSTFYFKDESTPDGKIAFGPVWDFDWGFDYENGRSYCYTGTTSSVIKTSMSKSAFWEDLTSIEIFKKHYYKVWKEFMENNSVAELQDYIDSYYNFAKTSFQNNAGEWGYYCGFRDEDKERAKQWVEERAAYIYRNLEKADINDLVHALKGDVNCNDNVTINDVSLITAYLIDDIHERFSSAKADCDANGTIDLDDAVAVAGLVLESDTPSAMYWHSTPTAAGDLYANDFELEIGADANIAVNLISHSGEPYNAIQFDVVVPDGVYINDIAAGEVFDSHCFVYSQIDMNNYRVVAYTTDNSAFCTGDDVVANINLMTLEVIEEAARKVNIKNVYAVNADNNEVRMSDFAVSFAETTGVEGVNASFAVRGGDCITVTVLDAQEIAVYSVDGRLVQKQHAAEGTVRIEVPAGMYIVNGQKVLVY